MPKIDIAAVPEVKGTGYPAPFDKPCLDRVRKRLGDAAGLTQFGVNLLTLQPGVWSSQRHWHESEDEFIYVLSGEVAMRTDGGEETLRAGDCAAFPKSDGNGHHLVNRSAAPATVLEIGTRSGGDTVHYAEVDLKFDGRAFTRRDGTPYAKK